MIALNTPMVMKVLLNASNARSISFLAFSSFFMDDGLKAESGQGWLTLHVAVIQATTWRVHYDVKQLKFVTEITNYKHFDDIQSYRVHNRLIQDSRKKTRHLAVAG